MKKPTILSKDAMQSPAARAFGVTALAFILALLLAIFFSVGHRSRNISKDETNSDARAAAPRSSDLSGADKRFFRDQPRTPEEIVAHKVMQFGQNRREVVRRLARHHRATIPPEVERFFDAIEAGNWEETDRLFKQMADRSGQYESPIKPDPILNPFWPAVLETYGAAEQAQLWDPKQLLAYGEAVLGSLKPGMVYIGGSDPGRFIPTLINETSSGERHVILTQNALADTRYLEYVQFLHGDRLNLPNAEDSSRIFNEYIADAGKRLEHDEQFPGEPKQIRHRESVTKVDGKIQVSGSTAVMDINERLIQLILERNPDLSFGLQESFPFEKTYSEAAPLGPIMELRAQETQEPIDATRADAILGFWQSTAESFSTQPAGNETANAYAHMAVAHANLLSHHDQTSQAEETYELALKMAPRSIDAVVRLSELLAKTSRQSQARQLVENFEQSHPDLKEQLASFLPPEVRSLH